MPIHSLLPWRALCPAFSHCSLCQAPSWDYLCTGCCQNLPRLGSACPQCALPLEEAALCPDCLAMPKPFAATFCPFRYSFPLNRLISRHKQQRHWGVIKILAPALLAEIPLDLPLDALVPMPVHWRQGWRRGFNPAAPLANALAQARALPLWPVLQKTRTTAPQKDLNRAERLANLAGAFSCTETLQGRRLLLVDDVMTTGATAMAASAALCAAGAEAVYLAVLARTG
jgi:ComF family protein